jgi:uncharacterized membrane protein YbhN (UPF0104 family)
MMANGEVRPHRRRGLQILGALVAAALIVYLIRRIWGDWNSVRTYPWTLRPWYLVASMLSLQAAFLIMARSWRSVLRAIGVRWPFIRAFWIFYLSNLGRYIPGNLWQMGAAAVMGRQMGVAASDIVASMIVHLLYFLPVGAAIALASGSFPPPFDTASFHVLAWAASLLCAASALWPNFILQAAPGLAKRLKLDPERWKLETARRLGILAQTVAAWVCLSLGFSLMVLAVAPVGPHLVWDLARIYIVAHILGYVVLLAPAGLGVREGVMVVLLAPLLGAGPGAGIALLARLWYTVAEVLTVGLSVIWLRRDRAASFDAAPHANGRRATGSVRD